MAPGRSSAPAPRSEPCPEPARLEVLERLATSLGVPVAAFFPDASLPDSALVQAAELVTAFAAIASPAARRTCLAFVRAMASY